VNERSVTDTPRCDDYCWRSGGDPVVDLADAQQLERELAEANRRLSEEMQKQGRLDEIAKLAHEAIKTGSCDPLDWVEEVTYILAIARGPQENEE
jgi:hypothetical protein